MKYLFLLISFGMLMFSCGENTVPRRVYTEKDIEGYWATNSVMQNTTLTLELGLASGNEIHLTFLRLYNNVCGHADTSFQVSGDTLLLAEFDILSRNFELAPSYTIVFSSAERLILKDIKDGVETTFYSLMTLLKTENKCNSAALDFGAGWGISIDRDSLKYVYVPYEDDIIRCGPWRPHYKMCTDSLWFERINELYCRLTPNDILFANTPYRHMTFVGEFTILTPMPGGNLTLEGTRGLERIGNAESVINPCARAIASEIDAADNWELRNMYR